jgi:hypothetical protein
MCWTGVMAVVDVFPQGSREQRLGSNSDSCVKPAEALHTDSQLLSQLWQDA